MFFVSPGSCGQVVELRLGGVDVLVLPAADRPQVLPAEVVAREVGLRVGDPVGARLGVEHRPRERVAVDAGLRRQPQQVEHRRHQVDARGLERAASREAPRGAYHERDVRGGVVDEVRVRRLAVVAQALAVVGGEDDERALEQPLLPQPGRQPPDHLVRVGDFAEVRLASGSARRTAPAARRACAGRRGGPRRRSDAAGRSRARRARSSSPRRPASGPCRARPPCTWRGRSRRSTRRSPGPGPTSTRAPTRPRRRRSRSPPRAAARRASPSPGRGRSRRCRAPRGGVAPGR